MRENVLGIADVEHFHWRLSEADIPVGFVENGSRLSLAAAVELRCIEATQESETNRLKVGFRARRCPIWGLLKASRWPEYRGRTKLHSDGVAVLVLPTDPSDLWWTQSLRELVCELMAKGFPANLARGLAGAVAEMVDNIWMHSEANSPGLLAYQVRRRKFAFSVADTGVGILASLSKNNRYSWVDSSMDAIGLAIQPGISSYDGGGMGFSSMLHAVADLWGSARLRSGEARLWIERRQERGKNDYAYLPHLSGVHVSVRCGLDPPATKGGSTEDSA